MRAARGRSMTPEALASSSPQFSRAADTAPSELHGGSAAQTYPTASPEALRAPRVPTDVGLSRSAGSSARRHSVYAVVGVILAVAAAVLFVAIGVLVVRGRPAPESEPVSVGAPMGGPVANKDGVASPAPAEAPTEPAPVILSPPPSALATTSAAPFPAAPAKATRETSPKPSARPASSEKPTLPKELGDLKLH
jgi:hypothetical protein